MNVFAKFDKIPSMILQDIKETKRYGHTDGRKDGQHENSIPSHKHSLRGGITKAFACICVDLIFPIYESGVLALGGGTISGNPKTRAQLSKNDITTH